MREHTPGPWSYDKDSRWPNCIMGYESKENAWIERVCQVRYLNESDARLIATSPDLLTDLIKLRCEAQHFIESGKGKEFLIKALANAVKTISKAEGSP